MRRLRASTWLVAPASVVFAAFACTDDATVLERIPDPGPSDGSPGMDSGAGGRGGTTGKGGAPDAAASGRVGAGGAVDASVGGGAGLHDAASGGVTGTVSLDGGVDASVDGSAPSNIADSSTRAPLRSLSFDDGMAARCEIQTDHTLWCWGQVTWTFPTWQEPVTPLQVGTEADWTNVTVGRESMCGVRGAGSLWCFGQVYDPSNSFPLRAVDTPERIGTDEDWAQVSAGLRVYLALKKDGTLWRWGSWFEITDAGVKARPLAAPEQMGTDTDWGTVTMGTNTGCAIKTNGALYCVGGNSNGRVGDGTNTIRNEMTAVSGGGTWTSVALGTVTCGTRADGTLWCWGPNFGNVPVKVGTDSDWVEVAGHDMDVVGRRVSGKLYSVQNFIDGLVQPEPIDETAKYTELSAHCGRHDDGTLWCWDYFRPRGDGSGNIEMTPVRVGTDSDWVSIALHWQQSLGLHTNGRIDPIGAYTGIASLSPVRDLYGNGENNECVIRPDGTLWCAGSGYARGGGFDETPRQQGTESDWLHIVEMDESFQCAIRGPAGAQQGTLWCNYPFYDWNWMQVGTDADWTALSAGGDQMCGLRADGSLWCWAIKPVPGGAGWVNSVSQFAQVGTDLDWTRVAVGGSFNCGIRASGQLWCSGKNDVGQLGIGTRVDSTALVQVLPGTRWSAIAAGSNWTCGIQSDGSMWCWGDDTYGQLGVGAPGATRLVPQRVGSFTDWQFVDASSSQEALTCGIRQGELYCWGQNASGLVTRTVPTIHAPVQVVSGPTGGYPFCAYPVDDDHDGYAGCYGDCDDENANVSPFAPESCNGIDDNCNQRIDEGCP